MLKNKQVPLIYLLLTVAVIMAFWQVSHCNFISYDDPIYVTGNIHIRSGVTTEAIMWAFTTTHASNWHPVTWISHMLDVQLFGLNPLWHHLTNLLFHVANTLLLFFVFHRMTKAPWKSAFVAALFALHPLHVESVAWVAERKDVLSTFLWMLSMGAYIHYVEDRRLRNYLAVLILFALGLMAKPMLVTLPFVLLLMDWWPLERMQGTGSAKNRGSERGAGGAKRNTGVELEVPSTNKKKGKSGKKRVPGSSPGQIPQGVELGEKPVDRGFQWGLIRPLLMEKIPLFFLAALSCIVTFIVQQRGGAVQSIEVFAPGVRIANALVSYILYIRKMVWPDDLAVFYPHPGLRPFWQVLGAVLLLAAVTSAVIRVAKRFPYLAVGWLWFTGTLVPVIGIVQVGNQGMADRYTYIPLIGLSVMAAWGVPELLKKLRYRKEALFAMCVITLPCLFVVTWTQLDYWRNSIALCEHALKVTDHNNSIHTLRGAVYAELGNQRQAIEDYDEAIEISPVDALAYLNRGVAYAKLGNQRQAIEDYDRAIQISPNFVVAYFNRGIAYRELGNHRQAISDFDRAIEINPEHAEAFLNRGIVHYELGNFQQVISDFDRAIEIDPGNADAYNHRGMAYGKLGNHQQAILDFDRAVEINPEDAGIYMNRGVVYSKLGDYRQAISDFDRAMRINPGFAAAYYYRGFAYGKLGDQRHGTEDLQKAARLGNENSKNLLKSQGISW
jgi:tetratricopeptide (TPR) repeat protein